MKKLMLFKYTILLFVVISLFFYSNNIFAQCTCAGTDYGSINVAGWTVGQSGTITTCQYGGERSTIFNTVAGAVYRVSTCGAGYDTQLSIYTTACAYIAYNDDNGPACTGTAASVQFTSPGGNLYAKMNQYNCITNTTCTTVTIQLISLPTIPFSGNNSYTYCSTTLYEHGATGNYSDNANGYTVLYPTGSNFINISGTTSGESCCDYVRVYNGVGTGGTILGTYYMNTAIPTLASTDATGALTVQFVSDISIVGAGPVINVSCCTPLGNPAVFGSNQWNVYAYNGAGLNLTGRYAGTYTETALSYDSGTSWTTTGTPSSASGYTGCTVGIDNHAVVYKRQGFPAGNYALSIPTHDDDIRVYINGSQVFEHIGCCDAHNNFWCGYLDGTSTIEVRHSEGSGGSQQALTFTSTGDPTVYGTNQWNIYNYAGSNFNTYYGYATNTTTSEFNLGAFGMGATTNPSVLSGYVGCNPGNDNWSMRARRQGFPCGVYNINLVGHDDGYTINIDYDGNGTVDNTYTATCCNIGLGTKWTGVLNAASRVEILLSEGSGDAYIDIDFVNITPAVNGGTIAGITNGVTICTGGDPGVFTNGSSASGGTVGYLNGGSFAYQWELSVNAGAYSNIGGATGATYDPTALTTGTYIYRRRATDMCGNNNVANTIQVNVVADPTITTQPLTTQTLCVGGTPTNLTTAATGGSGTFTYQWYSNTINSNSGGTNLGSANGAQTATYTPPTNTVGTLYYYCVISQTSTGCDPLTTNTAAVLIIADPVLTTPTLTNANICIGGSTTISTTASGGTGTFSYQWQYSADGISGWANVTNGTPTGYTYTNATTATLNIATTNTSPTGNAYYQCVLTPNTPATSGCNATSTVATLTIVADPTSPTTATKTPNATSVCEGSTLTIGTPTGGNAGIGCTLEYRYTQDGGLSYSTVSTTIPTLTANLGGYDAIQVRRNNCLSGCDQPTAWQTIAQWTVIADPTITGTSQPPNPICPGGNGTVSVTAAGGTDGTGATVQTYQWQYSADGVGGWANVVNGTPTGISYTGATTANLLASTTNGTTPAGTYYYRCIVGATGDNCATVTSAVLSITVVAEATAPTATMSPAATTVCVGAALTLTNPVLGTGGAGSQVFEYSIVSSSSGFSTTLPTINTSTAGSYSIWIRTNPTGSGCNISPTTQYTWTVVADPIAPTLNTATPTNNSNVCVGSTVAATFNAGSQGTGCTDEYQYSTDSGTTWTTYTPGSNITALTAGQTILIQGRRNCTGNSCDGVAETFATLAQWTIVPQLSISAQTNNQALCINGTATLSVTATGGSGTYNYQWQSASTCSGPFTNIIGANSATYTPSTTSVGSIAYQCIITTTANGCNTITTNCIVVTVTSQGTIAINVQAGP
ncbi:MAG TPA: hypothetical protein PK230_00015 [Chitinophagales bacterium]|nr:hypothetical protein [Chitinophagales bacterium]